MWCERTHKHTQLDCKLQFPERRVSIISPPLVLLWGASCSNNTASRWAGRNCSLLFSLSSCSRSLFNICATHHSSSWYAKLSLRHYPFIHSTLYIIVSACSWSHTATLFLPSSPPLHALLFIAGWHFADQWCTFALTLNEAHLFFSLFSLPLNFTHSSITHFIIIISIPGSCFSDVTAISSCLRSLLCALGICPYTLDLRLMSTCLYHPVNCSVSVRQVRNQLSILS